MKIHHITSDDSDRNYYYDIIANNSRCDVRLPADSLADEMDVAMATASASATANSRVTTLGTVPSNDTVVSNDTVLSSGELTLDMSSQSVEIITNEESRLLELDLQATSDDVTLRDLDPDTEGEFMSARFYIGESLPESPTAATTARKVRQDLSWFWGTFRSTLKLVLVYM